MTNCILGWNLKGTKWNIGQVSNEGSRSGKEGGANRKSWERGRVGFTCFHNRPFWFFLKGFRDGWGCSTSA